MSTRNKRIMITPSPKALSIVEAIKNQDEETKSEIFSRAVIIEDALRKAASDGAAVYIEKPNGDREKIVLVG
jgi:hypothetical protein